MTVSSPDSTVHPEVDPKQELDQIIREVTSAEENRGAGETAPAGLPDPSADQGIHAITEELAQLSMEITQALKDISVKLSQEFTLLHKVRQVTAQKSKELERIHKIDVVASSVQSLAREYRQKRETLEAEQAGLRAVWEEERKKREQEEAALREARRKEAEEHEQRVARERLQARSEFESRMKALEQQSSKMQRALEKDWQTREANLRQREAVWLRLRKDVEAFSQRLASLRIMGEAAGEADLKETPAPPKTQDAAPTVTTVESPAPGQFSDLPAPAAPRVDSAGSRSPAGGATPDAPGEMREPMADERGGAKAPAAVTFPDLGEIQHREASPAAPNNLSELSRTLEGLLKQIQEPGGQNS